jgi:Fuc2NAc and GlcNAc transferase
MSATNLFLYFLCVCLGGTGAWIVTRYGHLLDLLDKPNARSSHRKTTPKGGGIGILGAFITSALLLRFSPFFWIPTAMLSIISLVGDRYHLSPIIRLFFQFSASMILFYGIWNNHPLSSVGYLMIIPLSIYIVGTTNYYNFMDGINGIAGITGVVGFGLLSFYSFSSSASSSILTLNICLSLGCLGFLPFNFPRARVFMGDVGSILLGFLFAAIVVWLSKNFLDFVCLSAFLFPFYADELTTELVRLKQGEILWTPHRRHLYQLLANEFGIPHWKVSMGYGLVQLLVGISVLFFVNLGLLPVLSIIILYFFMFIVVTSAIRMRLTSKSA